MSSSSSRTHRRSQRARNTEGKITVAMEARGQVVDAEDEEYSDTVPSPPLAAGTALPEPMQMDAGAAAAASDAAGTEVTGTEFTDPAAMLDAADPLAAHMDALRRQLGGNFRDLTNHSDQPHLERYVEAEENESAGDRAETGRGREDPREFYARVMAHQRAMEENEEVDSRDEATAHLLNSVPPVTSEQAAMLAAQYAAVDAAARSAPAPDDERFQAAPPKPDQKVWVKDAPDRTPVRGEAESDDEDVALLKDLAALSLERSPEKRALEQAESDLAEAADSIARGDTMHAEYATEDGTAVEDDDLVRLSSVVDGQVADIASTMLAADDILCSTGKPRIVTTESGSDDEDPVATLLSIAAETAAQIEQPTFEGATLEGMAKDLTSMGVPPRSMGGGAGLEDFALPVEEQVDSDSDWPDELQREERMAAPQLLNITSAVTEALSEEMDVG